MAEILVIVDSIDVNDSSGSKANVALILNLKEAGYNVRVYHYSHKKVELNNIECILIPEKKWNIWYVLSRAQRVFTRLSGINIHRFLEQWLGFSFTFFNDSNSILKSVKRIKYKPDLVFTLSKAASFRPHYAMLKMYKWHEKWIAYVHDPYPFCNYPPPYDWLEPGFKKKSEFFKKVSQKAKHSAFPSLLLKEWMGKYFPDFMQTGIIIPHQNISVELKQQELPNFFDKDKFNILHAGSLLKQRNPEGLIKGFQLFLQRHNDAKENSKLILIGSTNDHKSMIKKYTTKVAQLHANLSNMPFNEVLFLQRYTSINVIIEAEAEISPFLPGKFPHCVITNKPILLLGPSHSEVKRLLGKDYKYHSEVNDVEKISNLIEELYEYWKTDKNLKLKRDDLKEYMSPKYLRTQIQSIIN